MYMYTLVVSVFMFIMICTYTFWLVLRSSLSLREHTK